MQTSRPIYLQIADTLCDDILQARYKADERIPSVRELAAQQQVNTNTVMRTFETLERDGIIFNRRGMGYYVSDDAVERITSLRRDHFFDGGEMAWFFSRLRDLGITPDGLCALYNDYLSQ